MLSLSKAVALGGGAVLGGVAFLALRRWKAAKPPSGAVIDLGFLKLPFEGKFDCSVAAAGIAVAGAVLASVFGATTMTGPALGSADTAAACKMAGLVTAGWGLLYYNLLGVNVDSMAAIAIFDMVAPTSVGPSFFHVASRMAGNMAEQAPVFLTSLWTYTLFADAATGAALGGLYLLQRLAYAFYYLILGEFRFEFESCTQVGYGVNGTLLLGSVYSCLGGNWVAWASGVGAGAPIAGLLLGSLTLFPGLPLAPLITYCHVKAHKRWHFKPK